MARPKRKLFYEEPLPTVLSETEQWLIDFHINSKKLVTYMLECGAKTTAYYTTVQCLTELRSYLLQNGDAYSNEKAVSWIDSREACPQPYRKIISRLSDIYLYGGIQPVNAFPYAFQYEEKLNDYWKSVLSDFIDAPSVAEKSKNQVKRCASRFLYGIQKEGIMNASDITYDVLEYYCQNDCHNSQRAKSFYTYVISDILLFMAEKGLCEHGLGWYPYFRMHGRILKLCDLSAEHQNAVSQTDEQSSGLPAEEFAVLVPAFMKDFKALGYSKSPCKVAKYTLNNLLLFMEMHGLDYNDTVVHAWLEHEKSLHESEGWKISRRILNLFHVYVKQKSIHPEMIFIETPLLSESLPVWFRAELENYLALKNKEGWEQSTLDMIRSSVTRFGLYLTDIGLESCSELTPEILKDFNLCDHHKSAEGKNAYNCRIRKFLKYLERKEMIPYGLHKALPAVAAKKEKLVVVLTEEEKAAIKERQKTCISYMELRDRVMMMIGLRMGLRASDIVAIRLSDIDWKKQTLRITQKKTAVEVLLPVPTDVANAIYLYIKNGRPNEAADEDYLFIKNQVPYNSLSRSACSDALRRTLPDRKVYGSDFHVLRKTYATERLKNGVGRQYVADLLGHKDTQSLDHYLLLDEDKMRQCPLSLTESGLLLEGGRYEKA